ncbi:MAG: replicative DNA helicase, partial [Bdellovibrionales bacterium]|nr:replicative DNA helicase [Bdellovibrionales bacterium]
MELGRRLPPQNIEAEQSVLGAVLLDNDVAHDVAEILLEEDFYREAHQKIFKAILALVEKGEPADLVTITNELKSKNDLERIGGATYLAQLVEAVPTAANVLYYTKIVKDKSILRGVIQAATEIATSGYEE